MKMTVNVYWLDGSSVQRQIEKPAGYLPDTTHVGITAADQLGCASVNTKKITIKHGNLGGETLIWGQDD